MRYILLTLLLLGCDIRTVDGNGLTGQIETQTFYVSVDAAQDALEKQLKYICLENGHDGVKEFVFIHTVTIAWRGETMHGVKGYAICKERK